MKGKITKYTVGFIFIVLLLAGIISSANKNNEVKTIINELNGLTKNVVETLGDSPSLESIKKARQIFSERKDSLRNKIKVLKDTGKLRNYTAEEDCSKMNNCSETAIEIDDCYKRNHNRLASINNNFLNAWNVDVDKSTNLIQELGKTSSAKEKLRLSTEIKNINKKIEANVVLMDELALLVTDYASITNLEEK